MKLYQIINAIPALNKLSDAVLPLPDAYRLQKIIAALQPDIAFFNEQNQKIIQKHGGKVSGGGKIEYAQEKRADAQTEFNELLSFDIKTDITCVQIPINENIKLSANDITALMPFVEFTEKTEKKECEK